MCTLYNNAVCVTFVFEYGVDVVDAVLGQCDLDRMPSAAHHVFVTLRAATQLHRLRIGKILQLAIDVGAV